MNDSINAAFELGAGFFVLLSIRKAYQDKAVAGLSVWHIAFIAVWGFWNIYYYPTLGQMYSFYAGVFLVNVNTIWVGQLIYYSSPHRKANTRDEHDPRYRDAMGQVFDPRINATKPKRK